MKSLYVHFPFCESKCHYCDFYSIGQERTQAADPARFETALAQECAVQAHRLSDRIDTIFFGGGTPSMTPPESMARALKPLSLESRIHSETEWTMEANPSSVDEDRLRGYRSLGVNRISMGVQALRTCSRCSAGCTRGKPRSARSTPFSPRDMRMFRSTSSAACPDRAPPTWNARWKS